jgi:prepilin-type N-terminal cleavage/methylation domain-containing protein
MKKTFRGFTLIELAIVIFAISVLTGIIVPNLQQYIEQAEKATDYANAALLYDDMSLVIASDDDAYFSFYSDGNRSAQIPVYTTVTLKNGEKFSYWKRGTGYAYIVTRCSGVDGAQAYAFSQKQGQGWEAEQVANQVLKDDGKTQDAWNAVHSPWYNTVNKKDYTIYTWEPIDGGKYGNLDNKNKGMVSSTLQKAVEDGTDKGAYFTFMLSQKMDMPVWGDSDADYSKTHFPMRYHKGTGKDENSKYVWNWMICYDKDSYEPVIYAGNGQINCDRQVYPDVTAEEVLDW